MPKKVRVGIIGGGGIGSTHIDALRRIEYVGIAALADLNEELALSYAKKYNIPKAYGDYRKLVSDPEIETIHIASPNYAHFSQAKAALEAGKHVVCEKPLGLNTKETSELVRIAKRKSVVNAVNFNIRFFPAIQQAKTMLQENELGDICIIRGWSLEDIFLHQTDYNWRMDPQKGGSSCVVATTGCHWLDLVQFTSGLTIDSVFADFANVFPIRLKPREIRGCPSKESKYEKKVTPLEEFAGILIRFDNDAKGVLTLSEVSAGKRWDFFLGISGLKGSIAWDLSQADNLWIGFRDKPNQILLKDPALFNPKAKGFIGAPPGQVEGYAGTFKKHFSRIYEYILEEKHLDKVEPDFPTFEVGHNVQSIMEAVVASANSGRWQKVKKPEENLNQLRSRS